MIISTILMFFGLLCVMGAVLLIALALSIISPVEGVLSVSGNNNLTAFIGAAYFGIFGLVQIYLAGGLWKLKKSAKDGALILAFLALITPTLELIGKYPGHLIDIALLPKFTDNLIIAFMILLLIIFILYFKTYKGSFKTQ